MSLAPPLPESPSYPDGRPMALWRLEAHDTGVVFRHGQGPDRCDYLGAREAVVVEDGGLFHLFYDGAGPRGWRACRASSRDLVHWERHGPVLDLGAPGEPDSAAATSPWFARDDEGRWHMFYLGTPNATPPPDRVPAFPYLTLKATAASIAGPWHKQRDVIPFWIRPGTYYSATASPGAIIRHGGEWIQYFSASVVGRGGQHAGALRTLGIARTRHLDGPWQLDPEPMLPLEEQVENSSIYHDAARGLWFLFTNHIGCRRNEWTGQLEEYTDAVWVYWSRDPLRWNPRHKAVVLDGRNCRWSTACIGMPAVIERGGRLALLYDAPGGDSTSHMRRDIGLAWLDLPLALPAVWEEEG